MPRTRVSGIVLHHVEMGPVTVGRVPQAERAVVPDAGRVHFIEQPEAFHRIVLEFLAKHRAR